MAAKRRRKHTAAKPKRTAGDDHLPPEIWREVLVRVPVKSIYHCRFVCKSWYSLVSCPKFISDRSSRNMNKKRNNVLLQLHDKKSDVWSFSSHDESFTEPEEHDYFPKAFLGSDIHIVGSCNGLICLSKYDIKKKNDRGDVRITFLIWNPSIRKIVELPSRTHSKYAASYFGFGFDSKTNQYKVLYTVGDTCEIFDTRKGVGRRISPQVRPLNQGLHYSSCYLDGVVYWSRYKAGERRWTLLTFSMSDECFREIEMPHRKNFITGKPRSVAFDGSMYAIVWKTGHGGSVWVMEEYGASESWTKVSDIDYRSAQVLPSTQLSRPKFLWGNGEVLMVHDLLVEEVDDFTHKQNLVLYDTKSRRCKYLLSVTKYISNLCLYEESLVWMSEMDNICVNGSRKTTYMKAKSDIK